MCGPATSACLPPKPPNSTVFSHSRSPRARPPGPREPEARPRPAKHPPKEPAINSKRTTLATLGCVAVIAASSTACLPSKHGSASPAAKVRNAFSKLGQQKAIAADIHLDATADQIYAAMREQSDFERSDADVLAGLKLSYAVSYDKPIKDVAKNDDSGAGSFALSRNGGKPLLEVHTDTKKVYARANLKEFGELARLGDKRGDSNADTAAMESLVRKADELPASMGNVKSALKGEWVVIDPETFPGGAATDADDDQVDAKAQKQVLDAVQKSLGANATFKDAGKKDGADHIKVTVPAKETAKDITNSLKPLADKLGDRFERMNDDVKDVPDKDITVDVAIRGGMVSGLTFDIAEFDEKVKGELPLTVAIKDNASKIDLPSDAKPLTPQDLMGAAMFAHRDRFSNAAQPTALRA
ncbi:MULTISPECIES: hypothetical protein [Streptomyces]|uniref:hypothetical protein n=1 Tax=Streptomyces TaxID=1883 RepID=UPI00345C31C3